MGGSGGHFPPREAGSCSWAGPHLGTSDPTSSTPLCVSREVPLPSDRRSAPERPFPRPRRKARSNGADTRAPPGLPGQRPGVPTVRVHPGSVSPRPVAHQGEFLVEDHLLHERRLVAEQVGLHVAPHVREPPEPVHGAQQQVVALVLLPRPCGQRGDTSAGASRTPGRACLGGRSSCDCAGGQGRVVETPTARLWPTDGEGNARPTVTRVVHEDAND